MDSRSRATSVSNMGQDRGDTGQDRGDTVHNLLTECDLCVKFPQWTCKGYLESAHRGLPMPRTPRKQQWTEEACYHVMNRGHNRERIFGDDDDRRHFLGLLARYRERFGLRLYHYCLMTNHFHVLVQLERPADLSKWLAGMLRAYVHYFNRRYRFVGHLWQGRFKSPAIQCEGYLLSCGRYIEAQPPGGRVGDGTVAVCLVELPGVRLRGRRPLAGGKLVLPGMGRRRRQPPTALA